MFVLFVQLFSILSTFVSSTSFGDMEEASELSSASWSTIGDICHVAVLPGSFKLWSSAWLHRVVQFIPSLEFDSYFSCKIAGTVGNFSVGPLGIPPNDAGIPKLKKNPPGPPSNSVSFTSNYIEATFGAPTGLTIDNITTPNVWRFMRLTLSNDANGSFTFIYGDPAVGTSGGPIGKDKVVCDFTITNGIVTATDNTAIFDSNFEQRLIDLGYDTIQDGQVLTSNIINVDSLFLSGTSNIKISNLIRC